MSHERATPLSAPGRPDISVHPAPTAAPVAPATPAARGAPAAPVAPVAPAAPVAPVVPVGAAAAAPTACLAPVVPPPVGQGSVGVSQRHRASEPAAVILAGDLLRWIIPKVGRFPKQVRHGLGARIEAAHLDVLEHLVQAQYSRSHDRARHLDRANTRLQAARHLFRIARELGMVSERAAVHAAGLQVELGMQVGAWHRSAANAVTGSAVAGSAAPGSVAAARAAPGSVAATRAAPGSVAAARAAPGSVAATRAAACGPEGS